MKSLVIVFLLFGIAVSCVNTARAIDTDGDGYSNWYDADFNNDGLVNFGDLALLRGAFGTTAPLYDLNSDGRVNFADLARFRALFGKASGGTATITWVPPVYNMDGSPLTDLAGYIVYREGSDAIVGYMINDPAQVELVVDSLVSGLHDFHVVAFDQTVPPNTSPESNHGSKVIE